jgi:hypothetical protein
MKYVDVFMILVVYAPIVLMLVYVMSVKRPQTRSKSSSAMRDIGVAVATIVLVVPALTVVSAVLSLGGTAARAAPGGLCEPSEAVTSSG